MSEAHSGCKPNSVPWSRSSGPFPVSWIQSLLFYAHIPCRAFHVASSNNDHQVPPMFQILFEGSMWFGKAGKLHVIEDLEPQLHLQIPVCHVTTSLQVPENNLGVVLPTVTVYYRKLSKATLPPKSFSHLYNQDNAINLKGLFRRWNNITVFKCVPTTCWTLWALRALRGLDGTFTGSTTQRQTSASLACHELKLQKLKCLQQFYKVILHRLIVIILKMGLYFVFFHFITLKIHYWFYKNLSSWRTGNFKNWSLAVKRTFKSILLVSDKVNNNLLVISQWVI